MKQYVIIVAGGSGTRMGADIPKQFLLLCGKPVLMHTIECFYKFNPHITIVLALPGNQVEYWQQLCSDFDFIIPHVIAKGGFTRFHSVKNALVLIGNNAESLVAIHDGVRPLVNAETIQKCFDSAELTGAAIPVIECFESVRKIEGDKSIAVDRSLYRMVQTPQVFRSQVILNAYEQPYLTGFTDDASVVEHNGHTVTLVEGNRENIKITTPYDMQIAEMLLTANNRK